MKALKVLFYLCALSSTLPLAVRADGLGQRVLFDAGTTTEAQWKGDKNVTVSHDEKKTIFKNGDGTVSSAAVDEFYPVRDATVVDLAVESVSKGQLNVQAEWLRADGGFIAATHVLKAAHGGETVSQPIRTFFPADTKPARFRLKFWLEGANAVATLLTARISMPRVWNTPDTTLVKTFDAAAARRDDAGMVSESANDLVKLTLKPATEYSAFVMTDQIDYNPKGVVKLDLAAIQAGSLTVQAICFGEDGKNLAAVPLLRDVNKAGLYEVAFDLYKDQIPAPTKKITFKVWLAGAGSQAQLAALFYGTAP